MRHDLMTLMRLTLLAADVRKTIDPKLGDLIDRFACGDGTVREAIVDRLLDLGRDDQAERFRRAVA